LKKIHRTLEVDSPTKLQTCASLSISTILNLKDMLDSCFEWKYKIS